MKLTKETCKIISALEYLIGDQCYNGNSYNGYTGEYGCAFRYPVYLREKTDDGYTDYKCRGHVNVTEENVESIVYKFGSNHLSIGAGIVDVLEYMSKRYNLDFDKLEKEFQDNKEKLLSEV